ncbi:hypothetical protein BGW36DRAFT_56109 [Talaromyces proteolyticus]|uniref:Uncharacterized protein n=1 Tax=Talaromyces proteolyticus TaxID=1131652 RepID=A0AAD4KF11_9EURO|nr:uncharacterized protein BGW36DRAFT_56109 [Talaromyces proteolyticus]KAH8690480.1 hypothetical protein BGW36DRAFT_56109 [Talaromyces proteolyticus]
MKRADESYLPKRMPKGRSRKWPTLVIEVGYSESHQKLVGDVSWWLSQSKGDVLTVLTVDINQRRKEITVEKWSSTQAGRGTSIYRTVLSQEAGQNDIHATNEAPLSIDFNHLFLRDTEGPYERIIEFDLSDLEYLSKQIWKLEFEEWTEDDYF